MNNTKEKKTKSQIITMIILLTIGLFAEMFLIVNFPTYYIPIVAVGIFALLVVYLLIHKIMVMNEECEAAHNEKLEDLYRSNKACYIMLKKSFDEIEERLDDMQKILEISAEENMNSQKAIAKVVINRSKENADAIIQCVSKEEGLNITDIEAQMDQKMQELLVKLKDAELRLNQAIMSESRVVIQSPAQVENFEETDEVIQVDETPIEEVVAEPEPVAEAVEEEKPEMPDMSDPNKQMSPDDIAALFANLAPSEPEPVAEAVEEEKPPMPDLSDPNKQMSPEEIAALIANL